LYFFVVGFWAFLRGHLIHSIAIGWDLGKLAFSPQFLPTLKSGVTARRFL
jgi:hypothetical protein